MKNKNILLAVIGGIVACAICAGIIFLYPTKNNELKGNENEEEIILGDCNSCMTSCLIDESQAYCESLCASDCSSTPTPTATSNRPCCDTCGGNTYCLANCVTCSTPTPTATATTSPTATATTRPTATATTRPTASPTPTPTGVWNQAYYNCYGNCIASSYDITTCQEQCAQQYGGPTGTPSPTPTSTGGSGSGSACSTCINQCVRDYPSMSETTCRTSMCASQCTTATPTATATTRPAATATAQSCSNPCCINGVTSYTASVCSDAAIPKTCGACPTTTPTPTPAPMNCTSCIAQCVRDYPSMSEATCRTTLCSDNCGTNTLHCYCNPLSDNCEWRDTNANNWVVMSNIHTQAQCNAYSNAYSKGCFKDSNNNYVYGNYGNTAGYTMVSGVSDAGVCLALNNGDPVGSVYSLSCPSAVVMLGQTIACTYSSSTNAKLASGSVSGTGTASYSVSGNYLNITAPANGRVGNITVYGIAEDGKKTNSVALIVSDGAVPSTCQVSISTGSISASVATETDDINSYYTVNVNVKGADCGGQTIKYNCSNCKNNPPAAEYTILAGQTSYSTSFKVYPQTPCSYSKTTATLSNGNSDSVTIANNQIKTEWKSTSGHCEQSPMYTSFDAADRAGANYYYTDYGTCTGGGSGYRTKWTRGGCGGGSVPACYQDSDNGYHWTSSPQASWVKVTGVTKETDCKDEVPACYKDPNGDYKWGLYARETGYTHITSIETEELCSSEGVCYKNKYDDYQWSTTKPEECIEKNSCWVPKTDPTVSGTCKYSTQNACDETEGYKVVAGVTKPEDCSPEENPACYVHGQDFVWGKYDKVTGYIKLDDIDSEEYCRLPAGEACYKDPDGNYVWGDFTDVDGYKLVASITNLNQCNNDVPTPSTGLDVSKVVYIFMAILMAFGIGFIYYSSIMKRQNQ